LLLLCDICQDAHYSLLTLPLNFDYASNFL